MNHHALCNYRPSWQFHPGPRRQGVILDSPLNNSTISSFGVTQQQSGDLPHRDGQDPSRGRLQIDVPDVQASESQFEWARVGLVYVRTIADDQIVSHAWNAPSHG